ncbi:hypothetical protein BRADI_2g53542v3 [Brachypodium distachyon]|uniref:Uncharacterized protein n=1 Tax=Brachypodium distachyon TaxID=15368 RepID=A0A0Q3N1A9_BRADI|nr:hypothetical protein BRADI_2g53542v3 [Brachypodium distachyon]
MWWRIRLSKFSRRRRSAAPGLKACHIGEKLITRLHDSQNGYWVGMLVGPTNIILDWSLARSPSPCAR